MLVLSLIRFIPSTRIGEVHTDAPEINYDKFMVRRYDHLQVLVNTNLELPATSAGPSESELRFRLTHFYVHKAVYEKILDFRITTPKIILNYVFLLEENKYFENAFDMYQRGVKIFKYFMLKTYGNLSYKVCQEIWEDKAERAIELFEHAAYMMLSVRTLYLQYAKLEEDYGMAKQAMKVYEEATKKVPECQRVEMCEIYISHAAEIFCDRAVYKYVSHYADPRSDPEFKEEVGLEVSVTQSGTSLRCNVGKKTQRNASDQEKRLRRLQSVHVPNVYHSYIKRWCKKIGVCEPVTGNVEGTELPEECDDESVGEDKVEIAHKEVLVFGRPARNREQDGKEAREGVENGNQGFGCSREDKETQTSSVSNDVDKLLVIQFGIVICRT
ncbi:hypothetical protein F2Q70_00022302 [Brassica cretica]|uniref:Pre-mRNA-splicing factor Syf1/CRNKL1-like C-terminal HAT-repeats domain-containing protein n=1 Tax=Brassica cretica TaxID=69181 RepID=A0A8S9GIV5_BRACR|nr:hypothetical protein F2Q70_00022302 [Brassica cretica]